MAEIKDIEIKGKTISKEMVEIIIRRIKAMPPNIKLAVLGEVLSRDDMIREIEENSQIGQEILEMELEYYMDLFGE